ncbi:MAG: glycosyltransferase [Bacillota bacterium]
MNLLIPTSARTALYVGCGDGSLGHALKRDRNIEVSGIEMSPLASRAREVLDRVYSGQVEDVAQKLPPSYFDCIVFSDVLERLTNPQRAITLLKKSLKPQGTIIVSARNARYWPVLKALLADNYIPAAEASSGGSSTAPSGDSSTTPSTRDGAPAAPAARTPDQENLRLLTKSAIVALLKSTGFEISLIRPAKDPDQAGMPEALRQVIASELCVDAAALAAETSESAYLVVARPATAVGVTATRTNVAGAGAGGTAAGTAGAGAGTAGAGANAGRIGASSSRSDARASTAVGGASGVGSPVIPQLAPQGKGGGPGAGGVSGAGASRVAAGGASAAAGAQGAGVQAHGSQGAANSDAQSGPGAKGAQAPAPPKRKPIASIVILTWNQKELTEKLLRSLETTTKVPHEVIVVDNGSSDGTAELLAAYAAERGAAGFDVRPVLNSENVGIAKGFNMGLKLVTGEYVVLLHNDVVLPAQWLERMIRHFRVDRKIGLVGPRSNCAKPHQIAPLGYRDLGEFPDFAEAFYARNQGNRTKVDSLGGFCLAARREVLAKTGLFDESYEVARYEDDDLCMRVRLAGFQPVVADDIYVHHSGSASFKRNEVDPLPFAEANRGKFISRWDLKPSIAYVMRWSSQSAVAQTVFKQANDLAALDYKVRIISLEGKPEFIDVNAEFLRVGAFEMLPPLEDDIVVVCSALDLPIIAPRCRGKLVHLCTGYESYAYGSSPDDAMAEKPQIDRYHSVPCARIVTSAHLRDLFETRFGQATMLVPGWLDPVLGSPRETVWPGVLDSANILFVGRPTLSKGFADFTAAIRAVRKKYPKVTMHLAVPPRTIPSQEKAEAMFDGPVVLHAGLSKTEMEALYRSVDVAVFPSWYEGTSLHVLEAMACGCPVITADSLGIRDTCKDGENALIVTPGYPRKLAQAITRLIEDEEMRQRLANEGPKVAAQFTHDESRKALQAAMDAVFRWETVPADHKPSLQRSGAVVPGLTSIVIVTLNAFEFASKCIDSIFQNSDTEPFELIVVDNGSTDNTWPFLEDLARKRKGVRVLRNPNNMGFSYAANQGIFLSKGEFIVMLHSDTLVTKGWLRRLKRIASSVPGAGLVGPVSNSVSGEQAVETGELRTMDQIQGYAGAMAVQQAGQTLEVSRLSGFCLMAKREFLDRVGVLDIVYPASGFEDDDLSVRARLAGYKCMIARDVFIYHFQSRTFADNNMDRARLMEQNRRRFLRKWAALLKGAGAVDADSLGGNRSTPLTGAERLARRIAERGGTGDAGDESSDFLPPEDMGPVAIAAKDAPSRPSTKLAPESDRTSAAASPSDTPGIEEPAQGGASGEEEQNGSSTPMTVEDLHRRADAQLQVGRFIIAQAMFERILKTRPLDVRARYGAALCAVQTGDTRKARKYLNSILSQPEPGTTPGTTGDLPGLSSEARSSSASKRGRIDPPSLPGIYNLFGVSFLVEQDYSAAAACFEKALAIDPSFAEAVENLRVAQEGMSRD